MKPDLNQHHYHLTEDDLLSRVIFKDKNIIVLNKPAGIPVHPGARGNYSLEEHFDLLKFEQHDAPTLAHRLDRDTSGCLILARRKSSRSKLGIMFENGTISKTYWAIVEGCPKEDSGIVENYLRKVQDPKGWYAAICKAGDERAKKAVTHWKIVKKFEGYTWLELSPKTGRTHQIRVHCKSLGCPIIGDWVYGSPAKEGEILPLLHLHARSVKIPFYHGEPDLYIEAPAPEHMAPCCRY